MKKDCFYFATAKAHGTKKTVFTGWTDVDLTEKGIEEAYKAGGAKKKKDMCSIKHTPPT